MPVNLVSAGGGTTTLTVASSASNYTATLPAGTGTIAVNGVSSSIVSGTLQASTSGTAITFSSIPSWVKRIDILFNGVSCTAGSSNLIVQLGAGSVTTSGYNGTSGVMNSNTSYGSFGLTNGFYVSNTNGASDTVSGIITVATLGSNIWVQSGVLKQLSNRITHSAGDVTLAGTLDRVVVTTQAGTDTFDAGSINILYQ